MCSHKLYNKDQLIKVKSQIVIERRKIFLDKITVVDSIMGSGKTSWAIQYMNEHPEKSFIYITPILTEVNRILSNTAKPFYEPKFKDGRKLNDFNSLILEGKNIVSTHSTFANANVETMEYLKHGNYCLILDEVLDILVDFNDVYDDNLKRSDINLLINEGFISIDTYGKVTWIKNSYVNSKYSKVERAAKKGNLFYLDKTMLVWQFPPQIFKLFKDTFVLTYLFKGSFLKPYFEYHNLQYEMKSVKNSYGSYYLTGYSDNREPQKQYQQLIKIHDNFRMNDYNAYTLSKKWYERQTKESIKKLQKNLFNYFHNIKKAKASDIMWTTYKERLKDLRGKGYNIVRRITQQDIISIQDDISRGLDENPAFKNRIHNLNQYITNETKKQKDELEKKLQCFVPCNARATNLYRDRSILAYMINMYVNRFTKRYFENKNIADGTSITIEEDYFALSCLLQWIWRSRIRDGQPISIYIPSTRMRQLLTDWLEAKI